MERIEFLVADIDLDVPEADELIRGTLDRVREYSWLAHTTHSHAPANGKHRYRIVLPTLRAISPDEFPMVWTGLNALLGGRLDPSTKDLARLYFYPSCPARWRDDAWFEENDGEWLDPNYLAALAPCVSSSVAATTNLTTLTRLAGASPSDLTANVPPDPFEAYPFETNGREFRDALRAAIPRPRAREDWRVGELALAYLVVAHQWPDTEAKSILDEWSALAPDADYSNNDSDWIDAVKRTRDRLATGSAPVTTHLSVLKRARELGWMPTVRPTEQPDGAPGDILNAKLFARLMRDKMLFVYGQNCWYRWDGVLWCHCAVGEEVQAAKTTAETILAYSTKRAAAVGETPMAKRLVANALRLQKESGLRSMLALAQSEPGMQVANASWLDSDPMLIGTLNGVVDLRTGNLLRADPSKLITRQCGAAYDRGATAPAWEQFQLELASGDREMVQYKQRALGYCLTGCVTEEKLFFAFGLGCNGKSVEANVLREVFGTYATTAPASMFAVSINNTGPRNDVARLVGARLVLANETQSGMRMDEQLVKVLVSRERIAARFLYGEYFEFDPMFKILMRGNHKPIITDDGLGMWRRVDLWPYEQTFDGERMDPKLEEKLLVEKEGILAWLVEGALEWQRSGLNPPARVTRASATYRAECDVLGEFIETECARAVGAFVPQATLYDAYRGWCQANGHCPATKNQLTRKLAERAIIAGRRMVGTEGKATRIRTYEGISTPSYASALASLANIRTHSGKVPT